MGGVHMIANLEKKWVEALIFPDQWRNVVRTGWLYAGKFGGSCFKFLDCEGRSVDIKIFHNLNYWEVLWDRWRVFKKLLEVVQPAFFAIFGWSSLEHDRWSFLPAGDAIDYFPSYTMLLGVVKMLYAVNLVLDIIGSLMIIGILQVVPGLCPLLFVRGWGGLVMFWLAEIKLAWDAITDSWLLINFRLLSVFIEDYSKDTLSTQDKTILYLSLCKTSSGQNAWKQLKTLTVCELFISTGECPVNLLHWIWSALHGAAETEAYLGRDHSVIRLEYAKWGVCTTVSEAINPFLSNQDVVQLCLMPRRVLKGPLFVCGIHVVCVHYNKTELICKV